MLEGFFPLTSFSSNRPLSVSLFLSLPQTQFGYFRSIKLGPFSSFMLTIYKSPPPQLFSPVVPLYILFSPPRKHLSPLGSDRGGYFVISVRVLGASSLHPLSMRDPLFFIPLDPLPVKFLLSIFPRSDGGHSFLDFFFPGAFSSFFVCDRFSSQ